jgi:hypothetical protein
MKRSIAAKPNRFSRISSLGLKPSTSDGLVLEQLRKSLLSKHQQTVSDLDIHAHFDLAANEAASIAWATTYPLLVFPLLLQEKIQEAERKARVQRGIYRRSQKIMTLAA